MPTRPSCASAINYPDDRNNLVQVLRLVKADAVSGDASDNAVLRVIARLEQTLGAGHGRTAEQHSCLSTKRLWRATQEDYQWWSIEKNMYVCAERAWRAAQQGRWRA